MNENMIRLDQDVQEELFELRNNTYSGLVKRAIESSPVPIPHKISSFAADRKNGNTSIVFYPNAELHLFNHKNRRSKGQNSPTETYTACLYRTGADVLYSAAELVFTDGRKPALTRVDGFPEIVPYLIFPAFLTGIKLDHRTSQYASRESALARLAITPRVLLYALDDPSGTVKGKGNILQAMKRVQRIGPSTDFSVRF